MHKLNLVPKEILKERSRQKKQFLYMATAIVLILIFIVALWHIEQALLTINGDLSRIESAIESYEPLMEDNHRINEIRADSQIRRRIYEQADEERIYWSCLIDQIFVQAPKDIEITSLTLSRAEGVVVEGLTQKNLYVSRMMRAMEGIDTIFGVSLGFSKQEESSDNTTGANYYFRVSAKIKGD